MKINSLIFVLSLLPPGKGWLKVKRIRTLNLLRKNSRKASELKKKFVNDFAAQQKIFLKNSGAQKKIFKKRELKKKFL